jgi:hypothetical protein
MRVDEFFVRVEAALEEGNRLALEADRKIWGGMGVVMDPDLLDLVIRGRWLNPGGKLRSQTVAYPALALAKLAEAALYGANSGVKIFETPLASARGHKGISGYQGGGRQGDILFGVSGLPEVQDLTIGLKMLTAFCLAKPLLVHHVGVRFSTRYEFEAAVEALERLGFVGVRSYSPDGSHERVYFELPGTGIYIELQFFLEDGKFPMGAHLDVIAPDEQNPFDMLVVVGCPEEIGEDDPTHLVDTVRGSDVFRVMGRTTEGGLWVPG